VSGASWCSMAQRRTLAIGFKLKAAVEFAGGGAVGRGRLGGEEFGEEGGDVGGPVGVVIAAGVAGSPGVGVALGAGAQIGRVELVEAGAGEAEFGRGGAGVEVAGAVTGQEMTDDGGWETVDQLEFFMGTKLKGRQGFCALELTPAGAGPAARGRRTCRLSGERGARVASPQSPILRRAAEVCVPPKGAAIEIRCRVAVFRF